MPARRTGARFVTTYHGTYNEGVPGKRLYNSVMARGDVELHRIEGRWYIYYTAAETVLRMRQGGGERGALFRGAPAIRDVLADLRRAQAEAEMICF